MASEEYNDEAYEEERFSEQEDRDDEHDDEDEGEGVASSTILARTTPPSSAKKNEVIRVLIKCFSSMVRSDISPTAIPDHKGRFLQKDMTYTKLFDASKYVIRAKRSAWFYRSTTYLFVRLDDNDGILKFFLYPFSVSFSLFVLFLSSTPQ